MPKNEGELLFEQYLSDLKLSFDYEKLVGTKRPDYLVHASIDVLCEIEGLFGSDVDNEWLEEIIQGTRPPAGRGNDPIAYINRAIRRAAVQLHGGKGKYPCLVVLHNASPHPYEAEVFVTQAMFGRLEISMLVGPEGALSEPWCGHSRKERYLTRMQNTTVSAVAVLEMHRPFAGMLDAELDKKVDWKAGSKSVWSQINLVADDLIARDGSAKWEMQLPRLRVYHNPWAVVKLPIEIFNTDYDEHFVYGVNGGKSQSAP